MPSLFEQIRESCRQVAEQARHVAINTGAIKEYAALLPVDRLLIPEMDPAIHYLGHGADTTAFILTLDAVNFGSGYFPAIFGPEQSGFRTVAAALNRYFLLNGPVPAKKLSEVTPSETAEILGVAPGNPVAFQLLRLYSEALNQLGSFVSDRFSGNFSGLVASAEDRAEKLVGILMEMPFFNDHALYRAANVPFFKRAQLTAIDLFIAFDGKGEGAFGDIDRLTICADNLVPHVLRRDGILQYSQALSERVDRGESLASGSEVEVEIRACAVHAAELIIAALTADGINANPMLLDNLLWHRGQEPSYRAYPRHRTKTVYY